MNFSTELAVHMYLDSDDTAAQSILPDASSSSPGIARIDSFSVKKNRVAFADLLAKSLEQENKPPTEYTTLDDMFPESITAATHGEKYFENPLAEKSGEGARTEQEDKEQRKLKLKGLAGSFTSLVSLISRKISAESNANNSSDEDDDDDCENAAVVKTPGRLDEILARPSGRRTWSAKGIRRHWTEGERERPDRGIPYYSAMDENKRSSRRLRRSSLTFANIGSLFRAGSSSSMSRGTDYEISRSAGSHLSQASPPARSSSGEVTRRSKSNVIKRSTMSEQSVMTEEDTGRRTRFTIALFRRDQ